MQARFAEDAPGTAGLRSEGTTEAVPAMANPVILVVDDDPQVLRAVERELRGRFGSDYRVVAAGSGADALDAIRRVPSLSGQVRAAQDRYGASMERHKLWVIEHGEDLPEVRDWQWTAA